MYTQAIIAVSGLGLKLFACLLTAMGVYLMSEADYIEMFKVAYEKYEIMKYYSKMFTNAIVHQYLSILKDIMKK